MIQLFRQTAEIFAVLVFSIASVGIHAEIAKNVAGESPWGPEDEIGTLNMMTDTSRLEVMKQVVDGKIYDLAVELFVGMPTCCTNTFGDPTYQIWMTHAPPRGANQKGLSHSGDGVSMYTHVGTHIDTLNHFGLNGEIWNHVHADDALGVRGWTKSGAEKYPPIIARGVLIDVANFKKVKHLPTSYVITPADLQGALKQQRSKLQPGDVVLIRTGLMSLWPDNSKYQFGAQAGLGLEAAQWLVDEKKVMLIGTDSFGVESFPSTNPENFAPVHSYLLVEKGVSMLEVVWMEGLARDEVYEFMFMASPLKMRGATGSPLRPIAVPIQN